MRLIEVIEAVAPSIEAELADAPDVQAAVQMTIGDTYRRLFMMSEAVRHLSNARDRMRAIGIEDERYAECLHLLGLALSAQSRPGGIALQEEALQLRRDALNDDDPRLAANLRGLGIAHLEEAAGDPLIARESLLDALARFERAGLALEVAETKVWVAQLEEHRREARPWIEEAVSTFEREAPGDPRLIEALNFLASLCWSEGDFERAQALLERSVILARERFGDERTPEMLRRHARLEFARGRAGTAERLSRRALVAELERWARRRPGDAPELRSMQQRLDAESEPPYAEAFALLRRYHGDGDFELANWGNGLSLALSAQGRQAANEPILREALNVHCRAYGDDCPVRQRTIELLATLLVSQGRHPDALPLLEETLATFERAGESNSDIAQRSRDLLEDCLARTTRN